jgi:hypothetical protein
LLLLLLLKVIIVLSSSLLQDKSDLHLIHGLSLRKFKLKPSLTTCYPIAVHHVGLSRLIVALSQGKITVKTEIFHLEEVIQSLNLIQANACCETVQLLWLLLGGSFFIGGGINNSS